MFVTMREIGRLFGVSSHAIGKWLVALGLRTADNSPSPKADYGGYVEKAGLGHGGYFWKWHRAKTITALEQAGHRQVAQATNVRIVGPFTARRSSENGYEIIGGDGTVSVWVVGEWNANAVTRLLNLGYDHGQFGGNQ